MSVRVLVVDDSSFFRRRVSEILAADGDIQVVATAADGAAAVEQAKAVRPDVITMDIEMPVLDGISAVRQIMDVCPTPILMFSSLTHDGARATLDALEAGALDFLPKKFEDIARNRDEATTMLQQRVKQLARKPVARIAAPVSSNARDEDSDPKTSLRHTLGSRTTPVRGSSSARTLLTPSALGRTPLASPTGRQASSAASRRPVGVNLRGEPPTAPPRSSRSRTAQPSQLFAANDLSSVGELTVNTQYKILAIGTSTGGPVALQTILTKFPANFPYPIILVQHMPATFTKAFAQRLDGLCKIQVKEAEDGDTLRAGVAYLAPGGMQMLADGRSGQVRLRVRNDNDERITYRPSVDLTFASLSKIYAGQVLGVILTGMGADGREGCRMLKSQGATIWAQDKDSCVVYGMPQAVAAAGISSQDIPLAMMARSILTEVGYATS